MLLNGVCYIYKTGLKKWEDAFDYCRQSGAVLAGFFDSCTSNAVNQWVSTRPSAGEYWISLRGYSGSGYHLDLNAESCTTMPSSGTVTAGNPLEDADATDNQYHVHLNGKIHYHDIDDPFTVLCMKRQCASSPCQNGGQCYLADEGTGIRNVSLNSERNPGGGVHAQKLYSSYTM